MNPTLDFSKHKFNYLLDRHAVDMANNVFLFDGRFRRTIYGGIELASRREHLYIKRQRILHPNNISKFVVAKKVLCIKSKIIQFTERKKLSLEMY